MADIGKSEDKSMKIPLICSLQQFDKVLTLAVTNDKNKLILLQNQRLIVLYSSFCEQPDVILYTARVWE